MRCRCSSNCTFVVSFHASSATDWGTKSSSFWHCSAGSHVRLQIGAGVWGLRLYYFCLSFIGGIKRKFPAYCRLLCVSCCVILLPPLQISRLCFCCAAVKHGHKHIGKNHQHTGRRYPVHWTATAWPRYIFIKIQTDTPCPWNSGARSLPPS